MRLVWVIATSALLTRIVYVCFSNFQTDTTRTIWIFIIGIPLVGTLLYLGLKGLLRNSKIYAITRDKLIVTDLIRLHKQTVDRHKVKGFSDSQIEYRIGTFKQIIIYLVDNEKFEIMQFEQFNFRKIKPTMIEFGYDYLGFEPYQWKFLDSRTYYYE
jgi:hypothetical protein